MALSQNGRHLCHKTQPRTSQTPGMPSPLHHPQVSHLLLRSRLRLALTGREANLIIQDKEAGIKVDNKIRRDIKYPVGIMDVLTVIKTNENYRMLYDVKGKFTLTKIKDAEAKFKLLKIKTKAIGPNKIPYIVTDDARTIRFPHPDIQ